MSPIGGECHSRSTFVEGECIGLGGRCEGQRCFLRAEEGMLRVEGVGRECLTLLSTVPFGVVIAT